VNSKATVQLITGAAGELKGDPNIGRAEAMRRSALALIDHGQPDEAHPAIWAPFVVVGEGGTTFAAAEAQVVLPPVTGALSTTSTNPKADNATAPTAAASADDKQTTKAKPGANKKARAKPKPDDWITEIFGQ
jgi:hypothetical protein